MTYQPIIGLEVHIELATKSKMFCSCSAEHFGVEPNTHTCPVCLGLPGALPVPNAKAIDWTITLGLALDCKINKLSKFDRKNYFYPDLPKGYQISQYDEPFCINGKLNDIRIRRVHLEEDTGKLQHSEIDGPASAEGFGRAKQQVTLIDFNRSGVPLVEIVTEPDFRTVEQVDNYLKELQKIVRYLGISGADMEKGSMRLEPSISLNAPGAKSLPAYRVELKNINSFRFARRALEYEINRQTGMHDRGEKIPQQTRGWNESQNATVPQREKEEANDYRYFPEPDIPPIEISLQKIEELRKQIPELPQAKSWRYQKEYGLSAYASDILAGDKALADYFEEAIAVLKLSGGNTSVIKEIANHIINKKVDINTVLPANIVKLLEPKKFSQNNDQEITLIIETVLSENPKAVRDYASGKKNALSYLIGQVIRNHPDLEKEKTINILIKLLTKHV